MKSRLPKLLALSTALLAASSTSHAIDNSWDGGAGAGTAWLTLSNWVNETAYAGVVGFTGTNTDIATFNAGTGTTVSINMSTAGGGFSLGAIDWNRTTAATLNNNSGAVAGTLRLNGATVGGVANTLVRVSGTNLTIGGANGLDIALGTTNGVFNVDASATFTISKVINQLVDPSGFTKAGTGIMVLSGTANNNLTGTVTVNGGRLEVQHNGSLGTGGVVLSGTSELQTSAGLNVANSLTASNDGFNKTLRHFNATPAEYSGNITINELTANAFRIQSGAGTTLTVSGDITGAGGFQKLNTGTLVLSGSSNFGGTLNANAGLTQLASTGVLDNVNVSVSGTMDLLAGSTTKIALNGLANTGFTGAGTLNLDGTLVFDLSLADLTNGNIWQVVATSTLAEDFDATTFSVVGFSESSNIWTRTEGFNQWTFTEGSGQLALAIIPEPASAAFLGLGVTTLLLRRRRR